MLGLFLKLVDAAVRVAVHDAETGRFIDRDIKHCNGGIGFVLLVVLEHLVVIHLIDVVAGQDQDIIRVIFINKIDVLIDGVCSAFVPFRTLRTLVGGQCVDAAAHTVKVPGLAGKDGYPVRPPATLQRILSSDTC